MDSAASGLIGARDSEFQAVFPVRGKCLNLKKAGKQKALGNQEIINIIKALGLEMNPKTSTLTYDKNKLRYGKILLCADADFDGFNIKNLLLTIFWELCPELILNGHVYCAVPPLFRITTSKNEYIFLKDQEELEEYKNNHKTDKFNISRNKGLGEQNSEELSYCLLDPNTRNVEQMIVTDKDETEKLFTIFMGTETAPRKQYILEHSDEVIEY